MSDPIEILDYWLGEVGPEGWYAGGEALDADIRDRFGDIWQAAAEGGLEHWVEGTVGTLAYLILCDQLGRNMPRGTAQAFAHDAQALAAAKLAVDRGGGVAGRPASLRPGNGAARAGAPRDHRAIWPVSVSQRRLGP